MSLFFSSKLQEVSLSLSLFFKVFDDFDLYA